jgi:hypothetical protein
MERLFPTCPQASLQPSLARRMTLRNSQTPAAGSSGECGKGVVWRAIKKGSKNHVK